MINPDTMGFQPDDPRINPELFRRVRAALAPIELEERNNFNPMIRNPRLIKARLREIRMQVIQQYFAEKDAEYQGDQDK